MMNELMIVYFSFFCLFIYIIFLSMKSYGSDDIESSPEYSYEYPYYLPTEVVIHNKPDDCWVSYMSNVYDLTKLCELWRDTKEIRPILANAGKDISHWFDHYRNDIRYHIHLITGALVPYCPHGPIPDVGTAAPSINWRPLDRCPWWLDNQYQIGKLTDNPRPIKIMNTLIGKSATIMVCEEDSINRIQQRFLKFNANGASYEWTFAKEPLNMMKTLTENGIIDERKRFENCGLPDNTYVPCIMCYYKQH